MLELSMGQLTKNIYRFFAYSTLQTGWKYFEGGHVVAYGESGTTVHAQVQGSRRIPYEVELELEDIRHSSCGCSQEGYCEHMAAVLFELCEQSGLDPHRLLMPGGSAWGSRRPPASLAEVSAPMRGKAADVKSGRQHTPKVVQEPAADGSLDSWHQYFALRFRTETLGGTQALLKLQERVRAELLPVTASWDEIPSQLYELHLILFTMELMDALVREQAVSFQFNFNYYERMELLRTLGMQCFESVSAILDQIHIEGAQAGHAYLLDETAEWLHKRAFDIERRFSPWTAVYSIIWADLLWQEERLKEEHKRLQELAENRSLSSAVRAVVIQAQMFLYLRAGEDERARQTAAELQGGAPSAVLPILEKLAEAGEKDRLLTWLRWVTPYLKRADLMTIDGCLGMWEELQRMKPEVEAEWTQVMLGLLPASHQFYTEYLMRHERYQEWVDLQLAKGFTPLDFRVSDFKAIETDHKELLLPWYHLSIERFIAEKNRDAYKRAVRLLKKLDQLYRKLKQPEVSQQYLAHLRVKYSRLRALQQEMQKLKKGGESE